MLTPRPYQYECIDGVSLACREERAADRIPRVLIVSPTGSGKTVILAELARRSVQRGHRPVLITHRDVIAWQIHKAITEMGLQCGFIQGKRGGHPWQPVQVAMVQTLASDKRLARYPHFDRIIIDEAHHSMATSYLKIVNHYRNAWVVGCTATPIRKDGKPMGDVFNRLVMGPSVEWLQSNVNPDTGLPYLCEAEVYSPSQIDVSGVHVDHGDYRTKDLEAVSDTSTITGDAIEYYRRYADRLPAIANCVSVSHAEHVAESFRAAGYLTRSVHGKTPESERKETLAMLADGRLHVVTQCDLYGEGADIPVVSCAIMLRPTRSLAVALQQMGRVLRPAHGKRAAIILDHAGVVGRWVGGRFVRNHGFPEDDREWSLESGCKPARRDDGGERTTPVRQCPACFRVHRPAPACPRCGHQYTAQERELEHVDGELVKVDKAAREAERARRAQESREFRRVVFGAVIRAKTFDDAVRVAEGYGMKPGYARVVWTKRKRAIPAHREMEVVNG
jgi:DNA repair protein RadD